MNKLFLVMIIILTSFPAIGFASKTDLAMCNIVLHDAEIDYDYYDDGYYSGYLSSKLTKQDGVYSASVLAERTEGDGVYSHDVVAKCSGECRDEFVLGLTFTKISKKKYSLKIVYSNEEMTTPTIDTVLFEKQDGTKKDIKLKKEIGKYQYTLTCKIENINF